MRERNLIQAAYDDDVQTILELLALKADINQINQEGNTALIEAARYQQVKALSELLSKKANIDHANNEGDTALILAARNGQIEPVKILLIQGANINHKSHVGRTALDWAIRNGSEMMICTIRQTIEKLKKYEEIKLEIKSVFLTRREEFGFFSNKLKLKNTELPKEVFNIIDDYMSLKLI